MRSRAGLAGDRWPGKGPRARAITALLLVASICATAAAAVSTTPVNEDRTVNAGEYTWVLLYSAGRTEDMEIDLTWNSTVAIDVWLMDRTQWDRFDSGQTFSYDIAQSGIGGHLRFTAAGARLANGSMYVVIDNTDRGATWPPVASSGYTASVTVQGQTWRPEPEFHPDPNAGILIAAVGGTIVAAPLLLVVFIIVRKVKRRDRHKGLKKDLSAGKLVGEAQPPPRPNYPQPPKPSMPYPPAAPQGYWAPPAPPAATACRNCGAPIPSHLRFCTRCGTPR